MKDRSEKTFFDDIKERFLNHRLGVAVAVIVVAIGGLSAVLVSLEEIRNSIFPRYELAIHGWAPDDIREFRETSLEFEVLLSGDARRIVDNATIALEVLEASTVPVDPGRTLPAFIFPRDSVRVPPLSPEVPQRQVVIPIEPQRPGSYTIVASVSAGRRTSQAHIHVSVAVSARDTTALQAAAPEKSPLLVVADGVARSDASISELEQFRILLPELIDYLGYFGSTLWFNSTYIGALGGDLAWRIQQEKRTEEYLGEFEFQRFVAAIKDPNSHLGKLEDLTLLVGGRTLVKIKGVWWYELTIIDDHQIKLSQRSESCSPLLAVDAGTAAFTNPSAMSSEGKKWIFEGAGIEIIEGPCDWGATGRICTREIEINGRLFEHHDVINDYYARLEYQDEFPVRLKIEGDRVAMISVNPISVKLCLPPL